MMNEKLLFTANVAKSNKTLNPFKHQLELTSTYDKIRTAIFTIIILPLRIIIICLLLILAWCLACIGLYGLTEEDLIKYPIKGWRKVIRKWICVLGRWAYYAGGMHITVKGTQAPRFEAPILVIAPHSTFLDAAIVYVTGFPSIIVRRESGRNPWLGKLLNYTQPVYVGREDRNSRQKTIQDIINRTTSQNDWPQVLIFPEGTCTNRLCLITFKPGAFYPGVPVQPVLIRYPNKVDTVTWTWDGPGAWKLLWFTLTRAHTHCEIEFLPVYTPNDEEKMDPKLYAHNVRNVMAKALGVPISEYSYEDCRLAKKAKDLDISESSILIVTQKLRTRLGLTWARPEDAWIEKHLDPFETGTISNFISKTHFATMLGIQETEPYLRDLFEMYSEEEKNTHSRMLNWRNYLLAVYLANKATNKRNLVRLAFNFFDGHVDKSEFQCIFNLIYSIPKEHSGQIYEDIAHNKQRKISYDTYLSYTQMFPNILWENNATRRDVMDNKRN